ncbi:LamG domain-containing protein [Haliangium sp. UPWRP_2]|uniref:LamG domain-containing protein n=1 Tax=Haliangium sp. UPWRP_2 TaxID=1931276 RepID=UPI000B53FFEE|nr:LamG domain-containing protein [Haliangium sp. UPWRP_2]PSM32026.1 hypothetical protein BVG81_002355 [Haliangium sp. UPWRP_2]
MSLITLPPNYKSDTVKHINSITHEGKVLVFATDSAGRVWYTVKQDGFEDSSLKQNTTLSGWENLKELPFSEQNDDPSVLNKQLVENTYQQNPGQYLLRSRYRTTFSTALAPVQLVSALGHVYVFRQSPAGTLLVDRYVLDGMTNTLNLAFEVRYKRSRQKYVPNAAAAGTASAGTSPLDTLDFYDSDGTPFIAPTTELCLVNGLQNGWFSVVFVPTSEPDVYRWHIFAFNHATGKIELTTLRASEEGLFDIKDYTLFEQSDGNTTSRLIPGIIRRQIEIDSFSINNGFAATKYDLQTEQRDKNGEKLLLKTATRILLAVPGAYQDRKSLQFDGESAYVEVPYHADLNSPQFSAACLARSEGGFGVRTVMGSNGEGCGYLLGLSAENRWQFALATAQGWVGCVAPLSATLGVFTQLVGTYDGATLRLYVNGVEAASTPAADYTPASSQPLRIGAGSTGTQPAYPFPGKIAGAAVWSRALSPAEIGAMGTQHSAYPNVLQGYYPLESVGDHGFGTLDQSGHNYHGSLVGPVRVSENVEPRAAALSFAIASDGTLSQLGDAPTATVIRSTQREILLPLSTLEEVKSYASVVPALQGAISGFAVGGDAESAQNLVLINTDGAADLANNDQVEISGTQNYQGVYAITKIDENRLKIQIPVGQNLGAWRRPENLDNGLLFDGKITSYQRTAGGELTITCPHHGMETGDAVQITGTESYNQTFSVVKIDNNRFAINRPWPLAEGVNVGQRLARRRGLVFDGSARVTLSLAEPATEVTHELWFKTSDPEAGLLQVAAAEDATRGCDRHLFLAGGNLRARIYNNEVIASAGPNLADGRWHHAAHVFGRSVGGQKLYVDGVLVASGEKASSDFDWRDRIQLGYSYDAGSPYLRGQLAEVRVWKQARSAAAIANNRYLQLRGNEVDLIGYWRLGAVVDGKVLDLSPSGKHGTISGNAYVSAITLNRTLQDGSAVIKYSNADLVAVSQHCVYEESFEFRVISTTPIDPMNVDGQGRKLFAFSHWGKLSRSSENSVALTGEQRAFQSLGNGWYRASCTFVVPADVNLLRCFELSAIAGSWQSLEVRQHRLRLLSDSLTEVRYPHRVKLPVLADAQRGLADLIRKAELKERQIPALLRERRELDSKIADYAKQDPLREERDSLPGVIESLNREVAAKTATLAAERANPLNYWCSISVAYNGWAWTYGSKSGFFEAYAAPKNDSLEQQWAFIPIGNGSYLIQNRGHQERYCTYFWGYSFPYPLVVVEPRGGTDQGWLIQPTEGGYLLAPAGHLERRCNYVYRGSYAQVAVEEAGVSISTRWGLNKTSDPSNGVVAQAEASLRTATRALEGAQNRQAYLNAILAATPGDKAAWEARLQEINQITSGLETNLNALNDAYLRAVRATGGTPQAMPQLAKDASGLVTQGAILGFVQPGSRLTVLESCDGCVGLSYIDDEYRMRQVCYDATADSRNSTFEQWLPEANRVCLDLASPSSQIALGRPLTLPATWSAETWFCYPLPQSGRGLNSLTCGVEGGNHVMIEDGKRLGMWFKDAVLDKNFHDCGADLEALSPGWHHLAVVSKGDSARFYLDGEDVGDLKSKAAREAKAALDNSPNDEAAKARVKAVDSATLTSSGAIAYIGGHAASGDRRFGRLAEVRIWGIALTADEVAVNSRTLLSGNEPGLIAYYPLNEASGTEIRDASGGGNTATAQNTDWRLCSAPIGRGKHELRRFVGGGDYVPLSPKLLPRGNAITVSFWARGGAGLPAQGSLLFATNARGQRLFNIHLPWTDSGIYFDCGCDDSGAYDRLCQAASPADYQGDWVHWAFTKDASSGTMKIFKNGQPWAMASGMRRPLGVATSLVLGSGYQGAVFDLRILPVAQSQNQIRASMVSPCPDVLLSNEYTTLILDPVTQARSVLMRRFMAGLEGGGIGLLPDKRIETLLMRWVGNAQFQPTLLGYVEGAPPIPSENLTEQADYNGATSVELTKSTDVGYDWNRAQEIGGGGSVGVWVGTEGEIEEGAEFIGAVLARAAKWRIGGGASLSFSGAGQTQTHISATANLSLTDKLALRGTPERTAKFPHLGTRFIPKNVGYALVVSALADVFVTYLGRSGKMVGYEVRPAQDIPPDVNTVTFLINPAYTMNGSLDGMTGSRPTSDRFFRNLPDLRLQYGSMYPASYYRLKEAYDLKEKIEKADKQREAYFANFDVTSNIREYNLLNNMSSVEAVGDPDKDRKQVQAQGQSAAEKRQQEINNSIADSEKRAHATASFAGWQRKMENIQVMAGKHNIVNNYVWDSDGGLHAETESFANTVQHTIGGSYSFGIDLVGDLNMYIGFGAFELTGTAGFKLTQTVSKTLSNSIGFSLNVGLDGVEYKGIKNYDDRPILPGQKVSRYRFMSFYLEGATEHFHDFFRQVVDPEWLAGNSEAARALRQVKAGAPNKAWRVLHRVTYVERPALSDFGQDVRNLQTTAEATDTQRLLSRMSALESKNSSLEAKIDQILSKLNGNNS